MIEMAAQRGAEKIYLHAFLDGRDCPPRSALPSLKKTHAVFAKIGVGKIATVCGRFYALDRDNRWNRVAEAYDLITAGVAPFTAADPIAALNNAYQRDENDEFVHATTICGEGESPVQMEDGDAVIFMNFRPDRARELAHALTDTVFDGFERAVTPALSTFVMTTEYQANIDVPCAYPPIALVNSMGDYLSSQGKTQLRIAETEKYAHVTFFFSGGKESLYEGEERILIPSPDVPTYDTVPEMSAREVTEKLSEAIHSGKFDTIICNYANCDQVGHTGSYEASIKAVETIDWCLERIIAATEQVGGEMLITADHGNVEQMFDETNNQPHTQHTTLPVPLVYVGDRKLTLDSGGSLADIAPTMLALMDLPQPAEMTGRSLVSNAS